MEIVLKDLVRQVIQVIRKEMWNFQVFKKKGKDGQLDYFTTSDLAAQRIYLRELQNCYPQLGLVGEEHDLRKVGSCEKAFFVIDPLDGTKAFLRQQTDGVGTMIAFVFEDECSCDVRQAFVGDVNTGIIYCLGSGRPHMLYPDGSAVALQGYKGQPLEKLNILLGCHPMELEEGLRPLALPNKFGGLFKNIRVASGGIGMNAARLWRGEVGAMILEQKINDPWDICPVLGISQKLGFVFLKLNADGVLRNSSLKPSTARQELDHQLLVIHKRKLDEVQRYLDKQNN